MNFEQKIASSPKSFDSTSSRFRIFDHFPKFSTHSKNEVEDSDDLDEEAYRKFSARNIDFSAENAPENCENSEKNENLHEWLITSYYGYGTLKEPTIFANLYPNLMMENDVNLNSGDFQENQEGECCSSESNSLLMAEKIELEQKNLDLESNSMAVYEFDYKLCKDCKSRYTRNRSTRWFPNNLAAHFDFPVVFGTFSMGTFRDFFAHFDSIASSTGSL
ncbi:unnamed protein product [Caenorhabditis angaria]|uniref:Uncharacterized protein n=1 Tax=Caenorhabditis angaria TaxID=860376 RepID=A0A9P1I984_9PELO|nr:unnamed protein product [Caenorhabditis angaria]